MKRALCLAAALVLCLCAAAEDASVTPTQAATAAPTQAPAATKAPEATEEATEAPDEPPTSSPTQTPDTPTATPTQTPDTPTATPTQTPTETPEPTTSSLRVTAVGNVSMQGETAVFTLDPSTQTLSFSWNLEGSAAVTVTDETGAAVLETQTDETTLSLPAESYAQGIYTLSVTVTAADGNVCTASLRFCMNAGGGFPGGFHGGFAGGSFPGGGNDGPSEGEQGFTVHPGTALTDTHASGDKDMTLYGAVSTDDPDALAALLGIAQEDNTISAVLQDDTLFLTAATNTPWTLPALALKTLQKSGVNTLVLGTHTLDTALAFSGSAYAGLRSQGFVDKDITLSVTEEAVTARVADSDVIYSLDENGVLAPLGA